MTPADERLLSLYARIAQLEIQWHVKARQLQILRSVEATAQARVYHDCANALNLILEEFKKT